MLLQRHILEGIAAGRYDRSWVDARLRASQNGRSTVVTHDGATLHVPTDRIGPHGTESVRIGVRPEKVRLADTAEQVPAGHQWLAGTVHQASLEAERQLAAETAAVLPFELSRPRFGWRGIRPM